MQPEARQLMTNTQPTIDLHQYWDVFRARKLTVIIPVLAVIALAAVYIVMQKPQYTAQAKVLVNPLLSPVAAGTTAKSNTPDMNTEQATADSAPVANLARTTLKVSNSGDRLLNHLSVSAASTGNVLQFQYTSTDAQQAAQYANAFAQAYVTYRNDSVLKLLTAGVAERKHTIALLQEQLQHSGTAQRAVLLSQLRDDEIQLATFQSDQSLVDGGQVIGIAVPPSSPSSPKIATTLIIAAVIGLLLGIILALLREGMDRRIKSPGEMESALYAPVLGVIPKFKGRSPDASLVAITEPRSPASEAYQMAAIALENMLPGPGARVVMMVSPKPGGGASTATANLGAILAQAGRQVILVSADLRNPTLHLILGLSNGRGVSTAVREGKSAERLLKATRVPNLFLLNAGPEPEDPAALLSSPETAQVFQDLQALKPHFILVDAPAALSAPDAMILSRYVDGTVVTWNSEAFRAPELQAARERLSRAGANILGGIYSFASGKARQRASSPGAEPPRPRVQGPRETRVAAPSGIDEDALDPADAALRERSAAWSPRYGAQGRVQS
jgi:capsular exopolysaccharide synthesis family protein